GLNVAAGQRAYPDIRPGRRNRQRPYPRQCFAIVDCLPSRIEVAEALACPQAAEARLGIADINEIAACSCYRRASAMLAVKLHWQAVPPCDGIARRNRKWRRRGPALAACLSGLHARAPRNSAEH